MSLTNSIAKIINDTIIEYNKELSSKYNLNSDELNTFWEQFSNIENTGKNQKSQKTKKPVAQEEKNEEKQETKQEEKNEETKQEPNDNNLDKLGKTELINLCKLKNLKCSGTKIEMIARLKNGNTISTSSSVSNNTVPSDKPSKTTTSKKHSIAPEKQNIINKIPVKIPTVAIRRNQFGNFEHAETSLIFDRNTQKVIGKQNPDGTVDELGDVEINICKKFKFSYDLPENLDKKANLSNVKVDELEEEELCDEDGEFEEEEVVDEEELVDEEEEFVEED
jgi:hypothetical protein